MKSRVALLALTVLVAASCGDDSGGIGITTSTTTMASTTTSVAEATTTTAAPTTTTTAVPATTTMAPTTTTTEAPAVELSDEGIQAGDTWVYFGYDDDDAVAAVSAVLGSPTHDSGWTDPFGDYGVCPAPEVRGVHWNGLILLFTKADTDFWTGGVEHFFAFTFTSIPPDLATTQGLMLGDTIADLQAIYGGPDLVIDESPFDPSAAIWSYDAASWTGLYGFASSQAADGVIVSINGGRGCGE
ncbi:MAG TPA: hypothetical protein VK960_08495 [Acidimicrobiia bacterium]|nr:hypothetical protein [Acidimicrobiia bacterium]